MAVVAVGTTSDGGTKMSDGTIIYPNKKKNVSSNPASSVNPTTGFDYLNSSFPTGAAAVVPTVALTGQGTTQPGILAKPQTVPVVQPVVNSMAGRKNIPSTTPTAGLGPVAPTPTKSIFPTTTEFPTITEPDTTATSVNSMAGRKNIPSSTINTQLGTTPKIENPIGAIEGTATTKVTSTEKTPAQIANEKAQELKKMKESDIAAKREEERKGTDILQTNNKLLMRLYGIDEQGNIDTTNPNGLAGKIEKSKIDYQNQKNQLLGEYSGARLRKVQSQIRQMLTSRGIDITKIPPEQLIQLSGEIGNTAFNDVFTAKEKTVNDILTNGAQAEDKINALREKGMLSQNDLRVSLETLRSKVLGDINNINKQFANDIFGIQDKLVSDKESRKASAINAITQFGTSLGLTGSKLGAITSYMNNFSNATDALQAMTQDLNNPASAIYKTVGAVEAANLAARIAAANLEERKIAATEKTAAASATRAAKTGSAATFKLTPEQKAMVASLTGKQIQDVTVDDYNVQLQNNTAFRDLVSKGTFTTSQKK